MRDAIGAFGAGQFDWPADEMLLDEEPAVLGAATGAGDAIGVGVEESMSNAEAEVDEDEMYGMEFLS